MGGTNIIWVSQAGSLKKLRDLIVQSKDEQIFIVLPTIGKFAESLNGVKILTALAQAKGKKLVFVSPKSRFREILRHAGFQYLAKLPNGSLVAPAAPKPIAAATHEPVLEKPKPEKAAFKKIHFFIAPRKLGVWLLSSVLGVLLLAFIFEIGLAQADVIVTLKTIPFSQNFAVLVADESNATISGPNLLRGKMIEVNSTEVKTFDASGSKNMGGRASGQVLLQNRSGIKVGLKTGTRLVVNNLTFNLQKDTVVPAATVSPSGSVVAGEVKAQVLAETGGAAGNLTSGQFTIPALASSIAKLLSVTVSSPFSGGADQNIKVVSADDIKKASDQMTNDMKQSLLNQLTKKVPHGQKLYQELICSSVVEATPSKKEGEEADHFDLKLTLRLWTLALNSDTLPSLVAELSQASLKPKEQLTPDSLTDLQIQTTNEDFLQRSITARISVNGHSTLRLDHNSLADGYRRKSFAWVTDTLSRYPDVQNVEIKPRGLLGQKMPWLSRNIIIKELYQN